MSRPSIFISYSHADETWKQRLVKQLTVLELEDVLEVWDDRKIDAHGDWNATSPTPWTERGSPSC